MTGRHTFAAGLAPALAWATLGLAAITAGSASCASDDPAADAALVLMALGAAAALAGLVLNVWSFGAGRDLGIAAAALAVTVVGILAIGSASSRCSAPSSSAASAASPRARQPAPHALAPCSATSRAVCGFR